ncbi:phenoloxidase-activating factor 2-like [Drosophila teissieri]|uniref:phenoloxidase-activating factor 2-like n=1 Tax=Drosophila teissieri TaxID=7243 RepID=UPI001CBA4A07|nr:phenoloxidase-activating factor 2-like [Drosophila teissieri]
MIRFKYTQRMVLMYGVILIVSLILLAGHVQSQNQDLYRNCGGSSDHHCVPRHLCRFQLEFRSAIDYRNLGCVSTAICCPKNLTINEPAVDHLEPIVNPSCGFINPNGVTFSFSQETIFAQEAEIPWMVALLDATSRNYVAGGALIAPHIVITAKQRIENMNANQLVVRAGEWDLDTNTEQLPHVDVPIRSIVRHPGFNLTTGANNVALVFLVRSLEKYRHINPVCLPTAPNNFDFSRCIFTGWGKKSFEDSTYMNIMKKLELPVVPNRPCQQKLQRFYGGDFVVDNSLMCAGGEPGKDSCFGDGGSPLACPMKNNPQRYELAGIVNFGINCGLPDVPGVYTNVASLLQWIHTEGNNGPQPEKQEGIPYANPQKDQYTQPNYERIPPYIANNGWQIQEANPSLAQGNSNSKGTPITYYPFTEPKKPNYYAVQGNDQQIVKPPQQDNDSDDFNGQHHSNVEYEYWTQWTQWSATKRDRPQGPQNGDVLGGVGVGVAGS